MMFELYPHQKKIIDELREGVRAGHKRLMLALATGAGKTVIAAQIALNATRKGKKVLFVVHMITLADQAKAHLEAMGLKVGILRGDETNYSTADDIVVASIQTIKSRSAPDWVELIVIDEAHVLHKEHIRLMDEWPDALFIGLSATPLREDLGKYFTHLVRGPTVRELTDNGFLVPVQAFCPNMDQIDKILKNVRAQRGDFVESDLDHALNRREIIGDIVATYKKQSKERQSLLFAITKAHSRACAEDFIAESIPAAHIEDKTPMDERRRLFQAFRQGDIRVLCSVGVLSTGFDMPDASCLILARPTLSDALHMQQLGRGIRPHEGKKDCLILDHAGNIPRFGLPVHFEVPDLDDQDRETTSAKRKKASMAVCTECGLALEPDVQICPGCGIDRPKPRNNVSYIDGELSRYGSLDDEGQEVDPQEFYLEARGYWELIKGRSIDDGYKYAYALMMEKFKKRVKPQWSWRDLPPRMPSPKMMRYIQSRNIAYARSRRRR